MHVHETLAEILPDKAGHINRANIQRGVQLKFNRPTTENDVKMIREAISGPRLLYNLKNHILVQCHGEDDRTVVKSRLQGATDDGQAVQVEMYTGLVVQDDENGPLIFGNKPPERRYSLLPPATNEVSQNSQPMSQDDESPIAHSGTIGDECERGQGTHHRIGQQDHTRGPCDR